MAETGAVLGGRFRVLGVLGRGGMATVHLVEDVRTGERHALKLLHPHLAGQPSARRRLEREVAAGRRLDHPGLLTARELFEADGALGLVLPLHPGHTLAERVAMEGPLAPDQVVRLGMRLAEALGAAHRAGVLHRDVSARNVLVDARGAPVLTDLGLARVGEGATGRSTALLGTAGFVAPEVLAGGRADPRSDLYGLGAVLYLAASGVEPFAAPHPQAALQKQLAGEVAPLTGVPSWLDRLIRALLDPDPARRPQGAAAVSAALEEGRAPEIEVVAGSARGAGADGRARDGGAAGAAGRGAAGGHARAAGVDGRATDGARLVRAKLPSGGFTVVVKEPEDRREKRKAKRALRKGAARAKAIAAKHGGVVADVTRLVGAAASAIEGFTGGGPTVEERLAAAVAAEASLPDGALRTSAALERDRFRLVAHVDRGTAERLADTARALGLKASVHPERQPTDLTSWLLHRWWVAIPLMWIAFPAVVAVTGWGWLVFLFAGLTVALSTLVGPWVHANFLPSSARTLPIAYTADLGTLLADGFRAASGGGGAEGPVAGARGTTESETHAASRAARFAARALDALDRMEAALAAGDVPVAVAGDLRGSVADLRREVRGLAEDAARAEQELDRLPSDDHAAWAGERLARLDTLARAGVAVDPAERARLEAAVAAHDAALAAEAALEARLTADLARLLEIDATARRLRRELVLDHAPSRAPEQALADLQGRARAAAAARRELG